MLTRKLIRLLLLLALLSCCANTADALDNQVSVKGTEIEIKLTRSVPTIEVRLPEQIHGTAEKYTVVLINNFRKSHIGLRAKVGCPCIQITEMSSKDLPPDGKIQFDMVILPPQADINQVVSFYEEVVDNEKNVRFQPAFAIVVHAKVFPPLTLAPTSIELSERAPGKMFRVAILPRSKNVTIMADGIRTPSALLVLKSTSVDAQGIVTLDMEFSDFEEIPGHSLLFNFDIPFILGESKELLHTSQPFQIRDKSRIEAYPSFIRLESQNGFLEANIIVRDNRATGKDRVPMKILLKNTIGQDIQVITEGFTYTSRQLAEADLFIFKLRIDQSAVPKDGQLSLTVDGGKDQDGDLGLKRELLIYRN